MFRNSRNRQNRWFSRLTILAIVLALTIATVFMQFLKIHSLTALQSIINGWTPLLASLRLMAIGAVALAWPKIIEHVQHRGRIGRERAAELIALRWRIMSWLLIIELLIGQNLIGRSLGAMDGAGT